jgi:hypothetical protein
VWSGFAVVVLTMAAYTAFQYRGMRGAQDAAAAADSSQPSRGSSSSSKGQLSGPRPAGELQIQGECSLQEDARRAALLSAAGSYPSCQLFLPLHVLEWRSSSWQQADGRSRSVSVMVQQPVQAEAGGWDLERQQQQQQRSKSMVVQPGR